MKAPHCGIGLTEPPDIPGKIFIVQAEGSYNINFQHKTGGSCGDPLSAGTDLTRQRGIGGGRFQPRASYAIRSGPGATSAVVDDLDHRGKPDLIVISGGASVLLGNGESTRCSSEIPPRSPLQISTRTAIPISSSDGRPDLPVSGGPTYVTACLP